ncbi:hypothetical protein KRX57_02630 [Weeksellaceae bacterium TAE3-ERU29]|nr:hypothetical protein [Weeksellaceae bacterium TAE3-ERU29]
MITKNKSYFLDYPEDSRLWVFMGDRSFDENELGFIKEVFSEFMSQWNTHGAKLKADFEIINNQFIVVIADQSSIVASGCSIDSLTRYIKLIEQKINVSLTNRMLIGYEDSGKIEVSNLLEFKGKIKSNEITPDTIIYDNSVSSLFDFREKWCLPLKDSWAKRFLG